MYKQKAAQSKRGEVMQITLKKWGNGTGIRFSKEFLRCAGLSVNDSLEAEIVDGKIVLTPKFCHQSLKERAAAYGGMLNLSDEIERGAPEGNEVW
jgi:antitoxin MazE